VNRTVIVLLVVFVAVMLVSIYALGAVITPSSETTLTWSAPTTNTDSTPITDMGGYKVYYGLSPATLSNVIDTHSTATTYTFANGVLPSAVWYFAVTAYDTSGIESGFSNIVSKNIDVVGPRPPVLNTPTGVAYL
jgi:hypothetical protein